MGYASGIQLFVFLARKLDMISCKRMIKRLMDIRMRIGCVACVACWGMGVAAQPLPPTGGWGLDDVVLQACQSSPRRVGCAPYIPLGLLGLSLVPG